MRARLRERARRNEAPLEPDDGAQHGEPPRMLGDLPARMVAEADLEHVEIERRVEIVAERPVARGIREPGCHAA